MNNSKINYDKFKNKLSKIDDLILDYLDSNLGYTVNEVAKAINRDYPDIDENAVRNTGAFTRLFKDKKVGKGLTSKTCSVSGNLATAYYLLDNTNFSKLEIYVDKIETIEEFLFSNENIQKKMLLLNAIKAAVVLGELSKNRIAELLEEFSK